MIDCLVIGGGPAGLTAAIYLARFHLSVAVVDAGGSRAAMIPLTRNHAGYPEGIAGVDLLARMRAQAELYGARHKNGTVDRIEQAGHGFHALIDGSSIEARAILLATGVVNNRPDMPAALHDEAVAHGRMRYCPICDGFEVTDRRVAVLGTGDHGVREALFLRSYTADVTLISAEREHRLNALQARDLADAGIACIGGPARDFRLVGDRIALETGDGSRDFDSLYPALGSVIRSELAGQVGADRTEDGCLIVDAHQRTSVAGLYAAGDVVIGLDQISHAMGEGGVAATTIRNDLAARSPLRR